MVASIAAVPLAFMLPVISKASSGAVLLIPTLKLESTLKTVVNMPAFFTRISILEPSIWCCITPADPSIPIFNSGI